MNGTDTLDVVQASIVGAGLGQRDDSTAPWMVYKGALPDSALNAAPAKAVNDLAICLYETPGRPPLEAWLIDYVAFQVVVRGGPDGYTAARDKIQQLFLQLHAKESALVGGEFVYCYATQSGPLSMGLDDKRRIRLAWNFRGMRNRVVVTPPGP